MTMKKGYKYIVTWILWLLSVTFASAQNLPLMPSDPAVTTGVLPNGMAYYLVNPINQIVGYLLSEDPTYITNYNNARSRICKIDRDELMQVLVREYLFEKE